MQVPTVHKIALFGGLRIAAPTGAESPSVAGTLDPILIGIISWLGGVAGHQFTSIPVLCGKNLPLTEAIGLCELEHHPTDAGKVGFV